MRCFALLCSLFLGTTAFSNPLCNLYDRVVNISAETIIGELECSNEEAVKEDVVAAFGDLAFCQEEPQEVELHASMCVQLADFLVNGLSSQIPEAWDCSLSSVRDTFRANLEKLCNRESGDTQE